MRMTFRWYGENNDNISLQSIKQVPYIKGIITSLLDVPAGELWELEDILKVKAQVEKAGLTLDGIESVNVHEDIKLGLPTRDKYIENYKKTLVNLGKAGIYMVCYNFMPVFDFTKTDMAYVLPDGSNTMAFDQSVIDASSPDDMFKMVESGANGFVLPGWEPSRVPYIKESLEKYKGVTDEDLRENYKYFLQQVIPVAEECGIKMAVHSDDPPWNLFGLPRIVNSKESLQKIVEMVDSPSNCLTVCTGSLGSNRNNDILDIVDHFSKIDRIAFMHIRNIKFVKPGMFYEGAHLTEEGDINIYKVLEILHKNAYKGLIRPDHGRMIWDEQGRPGYGLYDRALGAAYMSGIIEALEKSGK